MCAVVSKLYKYGVRRPLTYNRAVFNQGTGLEGYTSSVLGDVHFCPDTVVPTETVSTSEATARKYRAAYD